MEKRKDTGSGESLRFCVVPSKR